MLPYNTIRDAEIIMNRTLTFAETIWYNYSGNKSDFFLHCHNIIFLFLVSSLVPLPLAVIELLGFPNIQRYKIQPHVRLSFAKMISCYKTINILSFVAVPLLLASYPFLKLIGIRTGLPLPSRWELVMQLALYFIIEDYANYWLHRMLHCKWGYEKIHKVHHEFTAPFTFASPYAHWAEILILGIPSFLGPAMVPGHIVTFWLWLIFRNIESMEIHSGYDFPWTPTKYIPFYGGAEFHDYHHYVGGKSQSNFASIFTYCDYIYGTDKGYRYQKKVLAKLKEKSKEKSSSNTLKFD